MTKSGRKHGQVALGPQSIELDFSSAVSWLALIGDILQCSVPLEHRKLILPY